MEVIKWIGYVIAAILFVTVILAAVGAVLAFSVLGGVVMFVVALIGVVAMGLRDQFNSQRK